MCWKIEYLNWNFEDTICKLGANGLENKSRSSKSAVQDLILKVKLLHIKYDHYLNQLLINIVIQKPVGMTKKCGLISVLSSSNPQKLLISSLSSYSIFKTSFCVFGWNILALKLTSTQLFERFIVFSRFVFFNLKENVAGEIRIIINIITQVTDSLPISKEKFVHHYRHNCNNCHYIQSANHPKKKGGKKKIYKLYDSKFLNEALNVTKISKEASRFIAQPSPTKPRRAPKLQ